MDIEYNHMALLHKAALYAYEREYGKLMSWIDDNYFQKKVFQEEYYQYADDFIYRMDVTELSYSETLKLAYRALQEDDYNQFLLGLKIVVVKLIGNQRYTYYDRDQIMELLIEMSTEHDFERLENDPVIVPEMLLDKCKVYMPIGFEGMDLQEYCLGSTRSIYDRYSVVNDKTFDKEYNAAISQGNIYHHIVEIDHYINREDNTMTKFQWIHLAKLLSAHYVTEKAPWSKDLTTDLLRVYIGLKGCCEEEDFEDILYHLVTGMLSFALKKIKATDQLISSYKYMNIFNYIINVYLLENNNKYLDYILELMKVLYKDIPKQDLSSLKCWMTEHMAKAAK